MPFPVDEDLHRWRLGFRQFSFRHITRVPPSASLLASGHDRGLMACFGSHCPFRLRVSHRTQELSSKFLLTELGIRQGASWRTSFVFAPTSTWPSTSWSPWVAAAIRCTWAPSAATAPRTVFPSTAIASNGPSASVCPVGAVGPVGGVGVGRPCGGGRPGSGRGVCVPARPARSRSPHRPRPRRHRSGPATASSSTAPQGCAVGSSRASPAVRRGHQRPSRRSR